MLKAVPLIADSVNLEVSFILQVPLADSLTVFQRKFVFNMKKRSRNRSSVDIAAYSSIDSKMKILKTAIFWAVLVLSGCHPNEKNSLESKDIQRILVSGEVQHQTFSEIIENLRFIALETSKDALIGAISKVIISNNLIYILDNRLTYTIYVFNLEGRFKFKIEKRGKGPGEYYSLEDFCIGQNGEVLISDNSGKKILFFDKTGKFLKEVQTAFNPGNIASLDEGTIIVTGHRYPYLTINILNKNNKINQIYISDEQEFRAYDHKLVRGLKQAFFEKYLVDTIYSANQNRLLPKLIIDYGNKKLLRSTYLKLPIETTNGIASRRIPSGVRYDNFFFTESFKYYTFFFTESGVTENKINLCIYDKDKSQNRIIELNAKFDDLFGMTNRFRIQGAWENYFITNLDSYLIIKKYDAISSNFALKKPNLVDNLKICRTNLSLDSNPVLILFTINGEIFNISGPNHVPNLTN